MSLAKSRLRFLGAVAIGFGYCTCMPIFVFGAAYWLGTLYWYRQGYAWKRALRLNDRLLMLFLEYNGALLFVVVGVAALAGGYAAARIAVRRPYLACLLVVMLDLLVIHVMAVRYNPRIWTLIAMEISGVTIGGFVAAKVAWPFRRQPEA